MQNLSDDQKHRFLEAAHRVADYGLVRCSSGNLSWRLEDDLAAVSASKTWLADMNEDQIAICSIKDGQCLNDKQPSIETVFHLGILRNRADVNVVLHFQSPWATAVACGDPGKLDFNVIIEVPFYIGQPGIVDMLAPGSAELAEAVIEASSQHDMVILKNHGLVTVGKDFDDAIQKACFFELTCQILLCQNQPNIIPPEITDKLTGA